MTGAKKRLAVNADDFGFTRDVNFGIVESHLRGILTSTTMMANGEEFHHGVELAQRYPSLDIGVHFVLVGGHSLLHPDRRFPSTVTELIQALALRRISVLDELRVQIERILEAGIRPSHVDTHKHTHLLPPVLDAVARLAQEYGVKWVRRPFDLPMSGAPSDVPWETRLVSRMFGSVRGQFHRKLSKYGCATPDWFAGFKLTGRYSPEDVIHLLNHLPEGFTEFMTHPGFCTAELRSARTRLKESREAEMKVLIDPRVRAALDSNGIELTPYSHA